MVNCRRMHYICGVHQGRTQRVNSLGLMSICLFWVPFQTELLSLCAVRVCRLCQLCHGYTHEIISCHPANEGLGLGTMNATSNRFIFVRPNLLTSSMLTYMHTTSHFAILATHATASILRGLLPSAFLFEHRPAVALVCPCANLAIGARMLQAPSSVLGLSSLDSERDVESCQFDIASCPAHISDAGIHMQSGMLLSITHVHGRTAGVDPGPCFVSLPTQAGW